MRTRRFSKIQFGQAVGHHQPPTRPGARTFRAGGAPRGPLVGPRFRPGLHRTVLELDRAETLTREFLIRRAKGGDAFAARLLRDRYRVRVATVAEVHQENQRRALDVSPGRPG